VSKSDFILAACGAALIVCAVLSNRKPARESAEDTRSPQVRRRMTPLPPEVAAAGSVSYAELAAKCEEAATEGIRIGIIAGRRLEREAQTKIPELSRVGASNVIELRPAAISGTGPQDAA
jgi:hypothetical protein